MFYLVTVEFLLFALSNLCSLISAFILLNFHFRTNKVPKTEQERENQQRRDSELSDGLRRISRNRFGSKQWDQPEREATPRTRELMVSRDMQILLMIGSIVKVYWSCAPPPLWAGEHPILQLFSQIDVLLSPLLWTAVFVLIGYKQVNWRQVPTHFGWHVLLAASTILAFMSTLVPSSEEEEESWPLADVMLVLHMAVDGAAMMPQLHHLANSEGRNAVTSETTHFVGLLSFGRVFRVLFWFCALLKSYIHGNWDWQMTCFLVPDLLHTMIMGEFVWIWLKIMKQDKLDRFMKQLHSGGFCV